MYEYLRYVNKVVEDEVAEEISMAMIRVWYNDPALHSCGIRSQHPIMFPLASLLSHPETSRRIRSRSSSANELLLGNIMRNNRNARPDLGK